LCIKTSIMVEIAARRTCLFGGDSGSGKLPYVE
jgi:hypothetical protein